MQLTIVGMSIEILTTEIGQMKEVDSMIDLYNIIIGAVIVKTIMLLMTIVDRNLLIEDMMIEIVTARHLVIIIAVIIVAMSRILIRDDMKRAIIIVIMIIMTVVVQVRNTIDQPIIPDTLVGMFVNVADLMTHLGVIE